MPRVLHDLFLAVYFLYSDFWWECNKNTILKKSRVLGFAQNKLQVKHLKNTVK